MVQLDAKKWVNDYGDMLYRYAVPRVNDKEVAKDLVQDTFLAAWRNYDNFKGEISEKNWLFTILKNKIIDFLKFFLQEYYNKCHCKFNLINLYYSSTEFAFIILIFKRFEWYISEDDKKEKSLSTFSMIKLK